jgi:hypothetical protein
VAVDYQVRRRFSRCIALYDGLTLAFSDNIGGDGRATE